MNETGSDLQKRIETASLEKLYWIRGEMIPNRHPQEYALLMERIDKLEKTSESLKIGDKKASSKSGDLFGTSDVFKRTVSDEDGEVLSPGIYNLALGLVLVYGFAVNYFMVTYINPDEVRGIPPVLFLLLYFASCFAGVSLFVKSKSPGLSFLGYNLVVVPFGFVLNMFVSQYDPASVMNVVLITGFTTFGMMTLGGMFPRIFLKMEGALTAALLTMIVVELVGYFLGRLHSGITDIIVAAIFCGYIAVDWVRANSIPKTLDNAIDSAAALYMDIVNLFVRLLSLMGKKK